MVLIWNSSNIYIQPVTTIVSSVVITTLNTEF
jgi:hypothetical protein